MLTRLHGRVLPRLGAMAICDGSRGILSLAALHGIMRAGWTACSEENEVTAQRCWA
jgi:hypothetical protein